MIKVPGVGERAPRELSRQALADVVEPRYDELFHLIQAEIRHSGYIDMLAAGLVLTGGTSKMEGVVELAEEIFHMPVRIGMPYEVNGLVDIVRNPTYSTGVGLLLYGLKQAQAREGQQPSKDSGIRILDKVKKFLFRDD
jgi:cell division protein FtsA